jgi:branched-chain amino acid transport system ATP-binding protein
MLELQSVESMYKGVILALKGVAMNVATGRCVVLLGANGVGKSTTLKSISGIIKSDDGAVTGGSITLLGERIDTLQPDEIVRRGLVHVMEGRRPLEHLTVDQNLIAGGNLAPSRAELKRRMDEVYATIPRLEPLRDRTAGYLSGGEQQMMVIGRGLMAKPKLMLIDEPSLGLAPKMTLEVYVLLRQLKDRGMGLLIVEQNARVALNIADFAYVMEGGRIVMDGTAEEMSGNEDVREFYLGLSSDGARKSFRDVKHYRRRKRWLG